MTTAPRHNLFCAECGKRMFRGKGSLPQGEATCRSCRADRRSGCDPKKSPCIDCGSPSYGERCRPCADVAGVGAPKRIRSLDDAKVRRAQREAAAPGLSRHHMRELLMQWKRQGRRCTYCLSLATTIDHVVPLVRGGTNHEGNLTRRFAPPPRRKRLKFGAQGTLFTLADIGVDRRTQRRPCEKCGAKFVSRGARYCSERCRSRAKTHCKVGHEMTPENTRVRTSGSRQCRKCRAAERKAWKAKRDRRSPLGAGVSTAA